MGEGYEMYGRAACVESELVAVVEAIDAAMDDDVTPATVGEVERLALKASQDAREAGMDVVAGSAHDALKMAVRAMEDFGESCGAPGRWLMDARRAAVTALGLACLECHAALDALPAVEGGADGD